VCARSDGATRTYCDTSWTPGFYYSNHADRTNRGKDGSRYEKKKRPFKTEFFSGRGLQSAFINAWQCGVKKNKPDRGKTPYILAGERGGGGAQRRGQNAVGFFHGT